MDLEPTIHTQYEVLQDASSYHKSYTFSSHPLILSGLEDTPRPIFYFDAVSIFFPECTNRIVLILQYPVTLICQLN